MKTTTKPKKLYECAVCGATSEMPGRCCGQVMKKK